MKTEMPVPEEMKSDAVTLMEYANHYHKKFVTLTKDSKSAVMWLQGDDGELLVHTKNPAYARQLRELILTFDK